MLKIFHKSECHLRIAAKEQDGVTYLKALLIEKVASIVKLIIGLTVIYLSGDNALTNLMCSIADMHGNQ